MDIGVPEKYTPYYYDNYYNGKYEDTYSLAFPLSRILRKEWLNCFDTLPSSFADIGCGCGQTLVEARKLLPHATLIYGVECQKIPKERVVSSDIIFGDFMSIYSQLPIVDFLYCACSMYISWEQQEEFLRAITALTRKAVCFANVYITDGRHIPQDILRKTIYKSKQDFKTVMNSLGFMYKGVNNIDFYISDLT